MDRQIECTRLYQGQSDIPLNEIGLSQAETAQKYLRTFLSMSFIAVT